MKRSLVLAAFMVFSAAGALLGAPAAHAASAYDDLIQTTDKLTVSSGDSSINLASSECNWSRILILLLTLEVTFALMIA